MMKAKAWLEEKVGLKTLVLLSANLFIAVIVNLCIGNAHQAISCAYLLASALGFFLALFPAMDNIGEIRKQLGVK